MAIKIQSRRDTASNWTNTNPVPHAGEICVETDTLKVKVGNGSTAWAPDTWTVRLGGRRSSRWH